MRTVMKTFAIALSCCSASAFAAVMASQPAAAPSNQQLAQEVAQLKQQVAQLQAAKSAPAQNAQTQDSFLARKPAPSRQALRVNPVVNNQHSVFGTYVVTGPSVGVPTHYDGSALIVNSSSINEDYKLLQRSQTASNAWAARGFKAAYPRLTLSGNLEAQGIYSQPYTGAYTSDVDLTAAELDSYINVTPWVSGLMTFAYDNTPASESRSRVENSRLYLDKGFITIGNLNKAPIYGSVGQMYVPFGRYSHVTVADPLTEMLGRTKVRAATVGYHMSGADAPYASAYVFRGETSYHADGTKRASQYGADAGFEFGANNFTGDAGLGYISTIADSQGMLSTGSDSGFTGFDGSTDRLQTAIPGVDAHANMGMGPVTLFAEYVTATRQFSKSDMTYGSAGAQPHALNLQGDYVFSMDSHPMTFELSYNTTGQALALNLPKDRYMAALQVAVMRDTLLTFDYRYDENYGRGKTATGSGIASTNSARNLENHHSNTVTAQLDIYF